MSNPKTEEIPRIVRRLDGLTDGAIEALEARGIDAETAVKLGVVSAEVEIMVPRPGGRGIARRYPDWREWIAFRHWVDGVHDHWAYRTVTGEKNNPCRGFSQSQGTERRLWNNQCIRDKTLAHVPLIVTEGHLDALACMTVGFRRVVSIPDGALDRVPGDDAAQKKFSYLNEDGLSEVADIILAVDADHPGRVLHEQLAIRLGKARCRWVEFPDAYERKDANGVLLQDGSERLMQLVTEAKPVQLDGLYRLCELAPEPDPEVYEIGIPGLDDMWKIEPGNLGVLLGIPTMGKSSLITDVVCRLADRHGWVIAIGAFEDKLRRKLVPRLMRWYLRGDPFQAIEGERKRAEEWVEEHFVFLKRDTLRDGSIDWLCERAEWAVTRYNARMVVIDPWNKLNHVNRPDHIAGTEYVAMALEQIDQTAEQCGFYTLIAVHPTKPKERGQDGKFKMPSAYDCDGSAHWVNAPDNGITIHRDDDIVTIGSWKSRDVDAIGRSPLQLSFRYDRPTCRFYCDPTANMGLKL